MSKRIKAPCRDTAEILRIAVETLGNRWETSFNVVGSQAGWYRRMDLPAEIGIVATAQATLAVHELGLALPVVSQALATLVGLQRPDGGWPFKSNLDDISVVDSTSWAVIALAAHRPANDPSLTRAADWLESIVHTTGGWGLVAGADLRISSTAIAIRALVAVGRQGGTATTNSLRWLASRSRASGGWGADGDADVATTGQVLLAFHANNSDFRSNPNDVRRGLKWLSQIADDSDFWRTGPHLGSKEDVRLHVAGSARRLVFEHSPRPLAVSALTAFGLANTSAVATGALLLVDEISKDELASASTGHETQLTSWMLHDLTFALCPFARAIQTSTGSTAVIWSNGTRLSVQPAGRPRTLRWARRNYPVVTTSAVVAIMGIAGFVLFGSKMYSGIAALGSLFIVPFLTNVLSTIFTNRALPT